MDGLGACIKQTIKDTITFNPCGRSNTREFVQYMAGLSSISTYNEDDIIFYGGLLPDMDDLKIIVKGFQNVQST